MRALLLSPSSRPGGAERAFLGLVRSLAAQGTAVHAVLLEDGPLAEWLAAAGHPPAILPTHRFRRVDRSVATALSLRRLLMESQADVLVSSMSKAHVVGGIAARLARVPAVWWQHEIPERSHIERAAAAVPAAAVVCGSDASVAAQRRLTPHRTVVKIAPGLPVDGIRARRGSGREVRDRLGWTDAFVVGIVARLQQWKGQDVFLRAAARLAVDDPRYRFAVVGGALLGWEGSYPQDLERLATELGIAERTVFAGHQADAVAWTDALDVAVNASRGEPFGLSVVEAMALGKPVVATNEGGPAEIIADGVTGLLFPGGDHDALARAVSRLASDPSLAVALGAAATARAADFDEARTAAAFATLFESLAGGARATARLVAR